MERFRNNFYLDTMIPHYAENLKSLRGFKFDWTRNDANFDHILKNHLIRCGLDVLLKFGAAMVRAGGTASRTHELMKMLAGKLNLDGLSISLTLDCVVATARSPDAYETIVLLSRGKVLEALQAGALCGFVTGALALCLATPREPTITNALSLSLRKARLRGSR